MFTVRCCVVLCAVEFVTGHAPNRINPENFLSNNYGRPKWEVTSQLGSDPAPSSGDGKSTQPGGDRVVQLSATWTITQKQLDNITKTFNLNSQEIPTFNDTPTQPPPAKPRKVSYNDILRQLYGPPMLPASQLPIEDNSEDDEDNTTLPPKGHNISQHILDRVFSGKPLLLPVVPTPPQDRDGSDVEHTGVNNGTDDRFASAKSMMITYISSGNSYVPPAVADHPPPGSDHLPDTKQPSQNRTFFKPGNLISDQSQPSKNSAYEHVETGLVISVTLCIFSHYVIWSRH